MGDKRETTKNVVFVVAGGEFGDPAFFLRKKTQMNPKGIICADGGARHLYEIDLIPDVIIGDLDSLDPEIQRYCQDRGSRIIRHPAAKDETDTQLALDYAIEIAPDEIYVFGACGTRIDHTLANISLLVSGLKQNIPIKLIDEWCEIFIVTGNCIIEGEAGQTVSLIPFSERVAGITLKGFEYPLENGFMEAGKPYGISNRLNSSAGIVTVGSGQLLVVNFFRPGVLP
jgi:thiamine pyrophosphokinase